jgi:hypothetical protein
VLLAFASQADAVLHAPRSGRPAHSVGGADLPSPWEGRLHRLGQRALETVGTGWDPTPPDTVENYRAAQASRMPRAS